MLFNHSRVFSCLLQTYIISLGRLSSEANSDHIHGVSIPISFSLPEQEATRACVFAFAFFQALCFTQWFLQVGMCLLVCLLEC